MTKKERVLIVAIMFLIGVSGVLLGKLTPTFRESFAKVISERKLEEEKDRVERLTQEVLPESGFTLPISWGNLGPELIKLGVIDLEKFESAVALTEAQREILTKGSEERVVINAQNSQFVVDLLWAIGLAQKSIVYSEGPMAGDPDIGNYASTGGWTLGRGEATSYLGKFDLIKLTPDQQKLVGEIAKNIYRPCCGNPTWYPDCNHGMAALAAIEMMVAMGISEEDIYKEVLKLNSFWFPNTYLVTAVYFDRKGTTWGSVDAKMVLGKDYSSGRGAANIATEAGPLPGSENQGGSCGA